MRHEAVVSMQTEFWKLTNKEREQIFQQAGELLRRGELVAFPTETVYGLGANGLDGVGCKKIYEAKGRPSDNPLILHVASLYQFKQLSVNLSDSAILLASKFWPGPMTLVVHKNKNIPDVVTAGLDTVAIRYPSNKDAQELIRAAAVPIAAPSANLSGSPSPTNARDVLEDMNGRIAAILDGGECSVGVESTIIDTTTNPVTILRPGGITLEMVQNLLGEVQLDAALQGVEAAVPKAPGMKYRHYAPKAKVILCKTYREIDNVAKQNRKEKKRIGVIAKKQAVGCFNRVYKNAADLAENLFAFLRDLDREQVEVIYVETVAESDIGLAVMNRLRKAANN